MLLIRGDFCACCMMHDAYVLLVCLASNCEDHCVRSNDIEVSHTRGCHRAAAGIRVVLSSPSDYHLPSTDR